MGSCQRLSILRTISGLRPDPYPSNVVGVVPAEVLRRGEAEEKESASRRYSRILSAKTWTVREVSYDVVQSYGMLR